MSINGKSFRVRQAISLSTVLPRKMTLYIISYIFVLIHFVSPQSPHIPVKIVFRVAQIPHPPRPDFHEATKNNADKYGQASKPDLPPRIAEPPSLPRYNEPAAIVPEITRANGPLKSKDKGIVHEPPPESSITPPQLPHLLDWTQVNQPPLDLNTPYTQSVLNTPPPSGSQSVTDAPSPSTTVADNVPPPHVHNQHFSPDTSASLSKEAVQKLPFRPVIPFVPQSKQHPQTESPPIVVERITGTPYPNGVNEIEKLRNALFPTQSPSQTAPPQSTHDLFPHLKHEVKPPFPDHQPAETMSPNLGQHQQVELTAHQSAPVQPQGHPLPAETPHVPRRSHIIPNRNTAPGFPDFSDIKSPGHKSVDTQIQRISIPDTPGERLRATDVSQRGNIKLDLQAIIREARRRAGLKERQYDAEKLPNVGTSKNIPQSPKTLSPLKHRDAIRNGVADALSRNRVSVNVQPSLHDLQPNNVFGVTIRKPPTDISSVWNSGVARADTRPLLPPQELPTRRHNLLHQQRKTPQRPLSDPSSIMAEYERRVAAGGTSTDVRQSIIDTMAQQLGISAAGSAASVREKLLALARPNVATEMLAPHRADPASPVNIAAHASPASANKKPLHSFGSVNNVSLPVPTAKPRQNAPSQQASPNSTTESPSLAKVRQMLMSLMNPGSQSAPASGGPGSQELSALLMGMSRMPGMQSIPGMAGGMPSMPGSLPGAFSGMPDTFPGMFQMPGMQGGMAGMMIPGMIESMAARFEGRPCTPPPLNRPQHMGMMMPRVDPSECECAFRHNCMGADNNINPASFASCGSRTDQPMNPTQMVCCCPVA